MQAGKGGRVAAVQFLQSAAHAIPTCDVEAGLAPAENPRDGAQIGQAALPTAAGRPRAYSALLYGVDRGSLAKKTKEKRMVDKGMIVAFALASEAFQQLL